MSSLFSSLPVSVAGAILTVDTVADLPISVLEGSVRYVKDVDIIYTFDGVSWAAFSPVPAGLTAGSVIFSNGTTLVQDNTNFFWNDSTNRLGLGTTTPSEQFEARGSNPFLSVDTTGSFAGVWFKKSGVGRWAFGLDTTLGDQWSVSRFNSAGVFQEASLRISGTTGDVYVANKLGIGTTTPGQILTVRGTTSDLVRITSTVASGAGGGSGVISSSDDGAAMAVNDRLGFTIFGGARDAVGTIALPVAMIGIAAENFTPTATGGHLAFAVTAIGSTSRVERMRLTSAAFLGIGTTTPTQKLDVVGSVKMSNSSSLIWRNGANSTDVGVMSLDVNNDLQVGGANSLQVAIPVILNSTFDIGNTINVNLPVASAAQSLKLSPSAYATAGVPLTSVRQGFYSFAWNGSDGSTINSQSEISLTQLSAVANDARWDFKHTGVSRISIDGLTGNVGVGTTAPSDKLSVGSTSQFRVSSTGDIIRINDVVTTFPASQGAASTVLTNNGSGTLTWAATAGGWVTSVKTTTYTAVTQDEIFANSSGGAFTITLPATPTAGNRVRIADYSGNWATNNVTVARNGSNILGAASDYTLNVNDAWTEFVYVDSTQGWRILT